MQHLRVSPVDASGAATLASCPPRRSPRTSRSSTGRVLTGLALGSYAAVVLLRRRTAATGGYLGFTTVCAIGFGMLAWLSDGALPTTLGDSPGRRRPGLGRPAPGGAGGVLRPRRRPPLVGPPRSDRRGPRRSSSRPLGGGLRRPLVFGALAWGGGRLGTPALLAPAGGPQRGDGRRLRGDDPRPLVPRHAEAAGGAAHPAVARPPRRSSPSRSCCSSSGSATRRGTGRRRARSARSSGPWALFVWLRLIVGLVFPLVVSWAAVQTARTRSMESATGLLYINVGTIAAGTILAAGLYFGAGLLV